MGTQDLLGMGMILERLNLDEITFDGANVSTGVYFYKIIVRQVGSSTGDPSPSSGQGFVDTKKMLMIK